MMTSRAVGVGRMNAACRGAPGMPGLGPGCHRSVLGKGSKVSGNASAQLGNGSCPGGVPARVAWRAQYERHWILALCEKPWSKLGGCGA